MGEHDGKIATYEMAKKFALKYDSRFNSAFDYGDAYAFFIKNDTSITDSNLVIMKNGGYIMKFHEYLLNRNTNSEGKEI